MRPSAPAMVTSLLLAGVLLADEEPARSTKEYRLSLDVEKIQKQLAEAGGSVPLRLGPFGHVNGGPPPVDRMRTGDPRRFAFLVQCVLNCHLMRKRPRAARPARALIPCALGLIVAAHAFADTAPDPKEPAATNLRPDEQPGVRPWLAGDAAGALKVLDGLPPPPGARRRS